MKSATLEQIRKAAPEDTTVWNDIDSQCYRVDPKKGYTINGEHSLSSYYGLGVWVDEAEARKKLLEMLEGAKIESCSQGNYNCLLLGCFPWPEHLAGDFGNE